MRLAKNHATAQHLLEEALASAIKQRVRSIASRALATVTDISCPYQPFRQITPSISGRAEIMLSMIWAPQ
jgi:hypothetical protein